PLDQREPSRPVAQRNRLPASHVPWDEPGRFASRSLRFGLLRALLGDGRGSRLSNVSALVPSDGVVAEHPGGVLLDRPGCWPEPGPHSRCLPRPTWLEKPDSAHTIHRTPPVQTARRRPACAGSCASPRSAWWRTHAPPAIPLAR